jgi:hypothetical protein
MRMTNEEFESVPRRCYRMGYLQCLEDLDKFLQNKKVTKEDEAVLVWDDEYREWERIQKEELKRPEDIEGED